MSMREDLLKRLNGEQTEYIPWFADLSWYYFSLKQSGKLPKMFEGAEGEIAFYRHYKAGMCFYAPFTYRVEYTNGVTFQERTDETGIYSVYHTKYGDLTSVQKYLPSNFSWAYTKHFVEDEEELKIMAHIFESMRYVPDYEAYRKMDAMIAEDGFPVEMAPIPVSPVQKLLARWAGVENTVGIYADEPELFEDCVHTIEEAQLPVFDVLAGSGAQIIEFPENLSSEVTGNFFDEFNLSYYQKVNEILHRAGKKTGIHIDGTLNPCLGKLHSAGFDFGEAVTPHPVGDVPLEQLRALAGEELVIWGGLPGAMFTPAFTDRQFEEHIESILKRNDPKMILGVADQVPPDALDDRIREVSRLIGRG